MSEVQDRYVDALKRRLRVAIQDKDGARAADVRAELDRLAGRAAGKESR